MLAASMGIEPDHRFDPLPPEPEPEPDPCRDVQSSWMDLETHYRVKPDDTPKATKAEAKRARKRAKRVSVMAAQRAKGVE